MNKHPSCRHPGGNLPEKGLLSYDLGQIRCAECIFRCFVGNADDPDLPPRARRGYMARLSRMRKALGKFVVFPSTAGGTTGSRMRNTLKYEGYLIFERHKLDANLNITEYGRGWLLTPKGEELLGKAKMDELLAFKAKLEEKKAASKRK